MLLGVGGGILAGLLVVALILWVRSNDEGTDVAADDTTTTTVEGAAADAAGKDCVEPKDEPPDGAPAVPVKVGPPPTELVKEDLKVGDGAEVMPGDTVTAKYIGVACTTGKTFDESYSKGGEGIEFSLNQVIPGWTNGIPGMKVGGQRLLGIPADQAYGPSGQGSDIGPNEPLWFVVEITKTQPAPPPPPGAPAPGPPPAPPG